MNSRPANSPFAWKPIAGQLLERVINRVVALDPKTQTQIKKLQGRRISLHLENPPLGLELRVEDDALRVGPTSEDEPDLGIKSNLAGLLGQLPFFRRDGAVPVGKMRMNGDVELARQLQKIASDFAPQVQDIFVEYFGELAGPQMAKAFTAGLQFIKGASSEFAQNAAEFVTEEAKLVVGKAEQDAFFDDVDQLRERFDRLAARVESLSKVDA